MTDMRDKCCIGMGQARVTSVSRSTAAPGECRVWSAFKLLWRRPIAVCIPVNMLTKLAQEI